MSSNNFLICEGNETTMHHKQSKKQQGKHDSLAHPVSVVIVAPAAVPVPVIVPPAAVPVPLPLPISIPPIRIIPSAGAALPVTVPADNGMSGFQVCHLWTAVEAPLGIMSVHVMRHQPDISRRRGCRRKTTCHSPAARDPASRGPASAPALGLGRSWSPCASMVQDGLKTHKQDICFINAAHASGACTHLAHAAVLTETDGDRWIMLFSGAHEQQERRP